LEGSDGWFRFRESEALSIGSRFDPPFTGIEAGLHDRSLVRKMNVDEPKLCFSCGTFSNRPDSCANCGTPFDSAAPTAKPEGAGEREVWRGRPDILIAPFRATKRTTYTITTERVIITSEEFIKRDSLDLFRIRDVQVRKTVKQRLRGVGDVVILPSDVLMQELVLESIPQPEEIAATLRQLVSEAKARGSSSEGL
jgi:hypothetical protein